MEPTSTSLAIWGYALGSVAVSLRSPNRGMRSAGRRGRIQDIEPTSIAPDYPARTAMRAGRDVPTKASTDGDGHASRADPAPRWQRGRRSHTIRCV